jgi:hypothetical protein
MTAKPDEKGLLADTNRVASQTELLYIFTELVQNRKWNDDKTTGKFVFSTFELQGKRYLVIGYNHFRDHSSIEKEHTLFNWRSSTVSGEATIGTRGYGAKLLAFKIGGQYSNYYHLKDSDTFSTDLNDWGLKESINITKLQEKLNSEEILDKFINPYRENYIEPACSKEGVSPTLLVDSTFLSSELYSFFKKNNFKYFYVFSNYDNAIDSLLDISLERLANLYECNTAEIYRSKALAEPRMLVTTIQNSLGLCKKWWAGEFTLEWMIGEREGRYCKSICRYYNKETRDEIFSKLSSNGSKDSRFGIRHHYFDKETLENEWAPDISVTVAMTSDEYASGTKLLGTDAANRINIQIQGDFIDDSCSDFGLNYKIRHMNDMSRTRTILSILSARVKNNKEFGLDLGHLKQTSGFSKSGAIYEMVSQTIGRAVNYFKIIKETYSIGNPAAYSDKNIVEKFRDYMQVDKKAALRSTKRKKEAINFEGKIAKLLTDSFDDIEWDHKDSHISSKHGLNGEGIDCLGETQLSNSKNLWIVLQIKDKESGLSQEELKKFTDTLSELKAKYPKDVFLSYLVLAKKKGYTAELCMNMFKDDITVVFDPECKLSGDVIMKDLLHIETIIS